MVIFVTSFKDFKEYVDNARCIYFRVLPGEIRIYSGRVGVKVEYRDEREKREILDWLEKLKQTKTVVEIKDVQSEDAFFL